MSKTGPDAFEEDFARQDGLRRLQREIGQWSREKGWYDREVPVPESISLMHSELSEALEEWRNGVDVDTVYYWDGPGRMPCPAGSSHKPEGIGIELADCLIRILDFAERHNLDMADLVERKMAYNWTRPYRHGKVA